VDEAVALEVAVEHAPVLEAEVVVRVPVMAAAVPPGPISVAVAHRGQISIQVERAGPLLRRGPVFRDHRHPAQDPICQRHRARAVVVESGMPISARHFPATGLEVSGVAISVWASGLV
jgi:hypothetical protein